MSPSTPSQELLTAVFAKYDTNGKGRISREDVLSASLEVSTSSNIPANLPHAETQADLLRHLPDQDDYNFAEFTQFSRVASLRSVFNDIDSDGDGTISASEVRAQLCENASTERAISALDADGSGAITFDEFYGAFRDVPIVSLEGIRGAWSGLADTGDCGSDLSTPLPAADIDKPGARATLLRFLIAGGLGGIASRTATAPFELLKVQSQISGEPTRMFDSLTQIHREHGVRGLFRGNLLNCLRVFPFTGIICLFYAGVLNRFKPKEVLPHPMYEPLYRAGVGGVAGGVATLATYPLDVVRARLTVERGVPPPSIAAVVRGVVQQDGVRGLFHGVRPTLLAVVPFVAFQQSLYDCCRQAASQCGFADSAALFMTCGALAGAGAQTVVFPLDVVRRRLQVRDPTSPNTATSAVRSILKERGVWGLFCGLKPAYAKIAPSVAISLTVRDMAKDHW